MTFALTTPDQLGLAGVQRVVLAFRDRCGKLLERIHRPAREQEPDEVRGVGRCAEATGRLLGEPAGPDVLGHPAGVDRAGVHDVRADPEVGELAGHLADEPRVDEGLVALNVHRGVAGAGSRHARMRGDVA